MCVRYRLGKDQKNTVIRTEKQIEIKADDQEGGCIAEASDMIEIGEDLNMRSELSKTAKQKLGFMNRWGVRFLRQRRTKSVDTQQVPAQNTAAIDVLHEKEKSELVVSEELLSKRPSSRGTLRHAQSTPITPNKSDSASRFERHSWAAIEKKWLHVLECIGHVTDKEKSSCYSLTPQTQLFLAEKSS